MRFLCVGGLVVSSQVRQLSGLLCLMLVIAGSAPVRAQDGPLDEKVLKAVKHATVQLRVKLANDSIAEGSGWFAVEKGLIITNAHVLGMVDADSRRPQQVEATIDSGEANSKTIPVKFLGVDRSSDLAVLQADGDNLPEPLPLGKTDGLSETQSVYIFGFPFGKRLGKNITVSKSSVSSLRKEAGVLQQIQVNGGIHPGNSGGPVIDSNGHVVGVSVSAVAGTLINFAIPSDEVAEFLAGRVASISLELSYVEGTKTKVPVRLTLNDPLGRIKNITLDYWIAPVSKSKLRPGGKQKPESLPGDSPIKTVSIEYDGKGEAYVEVEVDPLTDAKTGYWFRPAYLDGAGEQIWHRSLGNLRPNPVERKPVTLKFAPPAGNSPQLELTDNSTFQIRTGADKPQAIAMRLKVAMNPVFRDSKGASSTQMGLTYSSFSIGVSVNGEVVKNQSDEFKIIGQNVLKTSAAVEFDADGSVLRTQPDLRKVTKDKLPQITEITDHFLQSLDLLYLPLPDGEIQPAAVLRTQRNLSVGLPGMFVPALAVLKFQYLGTRTYANQPSAMFEVTGAIRGQRGAGLNVGGRVKGTVDVSIKTGQILQGNADVKLDLEIPEARQPIRLTGTLALQIRPTGSITVTLGKPVEPDEELEVGAKLFAEREKKWLPAKILEVKSDGLVRIQFDGHEEEWDEDVSRSRLRFATK